MKLLVLALPGSGALAATLAGHLHCDWSELAQHRFPDGETLVRIDVPVQGCCVVLAANLDRPDGKTLPLLFAADAARDLGAAQVALAASLDFMVAVDPHLHRWHGLGELYLIRTRVVAAAPLIAQWLRDNVEDPLVIGPDAESEQWVSEVARLAGAPWTVLAKTRRGDRDIAVRMPARGPLPGGTPVLLDDIISTGETLLAATRALGEAGLAAPLCIGVHALFDGEALQRLLAAGVTRVVTCDTVVHPTNAIHVGQAMAQAVLALAPDQCARP